MSVVSAVVSRRALAVHIHGLGATANGIVIQGWTGDGYSSSFVQRLVTLTTQVAATAELFAATTSSSPTTSGSSDPAAGLNTTAPADRPNATA